MKRKSVFLILISLISAFVLTMTVFAEGNSVVIEVTTTIDNSPDFTVSIPTVIPMGELSRTAESSVKAKTFSIKLEDDSGLSGKQVDIFVEAPGGEFAMYYDVYRLPYHLYNQALGGDPLESGALFASFAQKGEVTGRVEVDEMNIPATGTYSGSLQFIVTIRDP